MTRTRSFGLLRGLIALLCLISPQSGAFAQPEAHSPWQKRSGEGLSEPVIARNAASKPPVGWVGPTEYLQLGTSGVSAMQLAVVTDRYVIIYDKPEHNPAKTSNGVNAWAVLLDTQEHTYRPLHVNTDTFCAGGFSGSQLKA